MDEGACEESRPVFTWRWFQVYREPCMSWLMAGPFRILWYDARDRENWKLDYILHRDCVQFGIGPLVLVWVGNHGELDAT